MPDTLLNIQVIPPGVTKWGGKVVLTAHGCALWERFTGKNYGYRVVNLLTKDWAYLCHKSQPVPESEREAMIERFLASGTEPKPKPVPRSKRNVERARSDTAPVDMLTESLTYIFEKLLPEHGYSLRSEQLKLAEDILEALRSRSVSLAEAGVGIGKTHAYLIAAALIKRGHVIDFWLRGQYPGMAHIAEMPILIATSSIALQRAIVKDYIPEISRILLADGVITKPLTGVIRKGKEHYICEKRLRLFYEQSKRDGVKPLLEPLAGGKGGIDLDEMDSLDAYTKRRINVAGACGKNCGWARECRYRAFLNDAKSDKYDFQICNHNYLLADVMHRTKGQRPLMPNHQAIVIDEAHKFLQAARSMYGMELSSRTLPRMVKTIRSFIFNQGQSTAGLWRDADKLTGQSGRLFEVLTGNIPDIYTDDDAERFKTDIDGAAERYLQTISEVLGRLTEELEKRQVLPKYQSLYDSTLWQLNAVKKQITAFEKHGNLIYWLETPEDETLLCAIPKRLGEMLHTDLWSKGIPIVLTSGTLSAAGDFTHVKLGTGLDRLPSGKVLETSRPSPFNYRENALLYISESVPFPDSRNARYIGAVADEVERLVKASHGHAVILFTSYRAMDMVFDKLKKRRLPFPLFKLGKGGTNAIERFRQSGNGVLLASGSMWEGVDLPGDILSMLVIVKLPFAVPDPISDYERERFGNFEKYKNAVIIPEMLVKLLQGYGRLIRTMTDTGVVALLDFRVRVNGLYRGWVLRALPDCRVTDSVGEVEGFFKKKKPEAYFDNNFCVDREG